MTIVKERAPKPQPNSPPIRVITKASVVGFAPRIFHPMFAYQAARGQIMATTPPMIASVGHR